MQTNYVGYVTLQRLLEAQYVSGVSTEFLKTISFFLAYAKITSCNNNISLTFWILTDHARQFCRRFNVK